MSNCILEEYNGEYFPVILKTIVRENPECFNFPKDILDSKIQNEVRSKIKLLLIRNAVSNEEVGFITLEFNQNNNDYELEIGISARFRRQKFAKEALKVLDSLLFNKRVRLYAVIKNDNPYKDIIKKLLVNSGFNVIHDFTSIEDFINAYELVKTY